MYARFIAAGRLTADPSDGLKKRTINGEEVSVCDFTIACDPEPGSTKGTDFYPCEVWRKTADNLATYMSKGQAILVEGRPHEDTWEKDGVKRSRTKYSINVVKFLERGKGKVETTVNEDEIPF